MAYPATKFLTEDYSDILSIATPADTTDRPVFFIASSADKGPEEYKQKLRNDKFYKLYGTTPSFARHGQPLLTAANIVDNGGRVTFKRIVAEDATLANIAVVANVKAQQDQKVDDNGNPLYLAADGVTETTDPTTGVVATEQKVHISYTLKNVNIAGNSVKAMAANLLSSSAHTNQVGQDGSYLLFFIADNGRGESNKKFRIVADTTQSRPVDYVKYIFTVLENGTELEHFAFTMNPDTIEEGKNLSLENVISQYALQIRGKIFESEINAMIENVSYLSGIEQKEYMNADILFGNNLYGSSYSKIVMEGSVQLDNINGISLVGGSNGLFENYPINASTYASELVKAFNGSDGDEIYDLDNFRIDVVFDCKYPAAVKRAIEDLATFREDFCYIRDMGVDLTSIDMVKIVKATELKSRFCASYHNSWDVIDPYTKKQITVTAPYSLAGKFCKHFINGVARPFCGQTYGITWTTDEVIEGTVNFVPKNVPAVDQKQWFDDNRINYASYYDGLLTMETEYTSQERYTQLSWLHNVLNLQSLIREIRVFCPKNRYRFIDTNDLKEYQKDVNTVLDKHSADFYALKMVYAKDENYENNKIYYAYIYVEFRNFVQSELFKIIVLKTGASMPD